MSLTKLGSMPSAVVFRRPSLSYFQWSRTRWVARNVDVSLSTLGGVRRLATAIPSIRNHRSQHSSEWIRRHITDPYVQRAQECDYRSRSAFKLEQLDDEYLFLRKDRIILDLGCCPGGWCQVAAKRCLVGQGATGGISGVAPSPSTSRVIGVDIARMDPLPNVQFIQGRVGDAKTLYAVLQELRDQKADVVLSDMAPACTGIRHDDHYNSVELCLYAADFMEQVLCLGGTFIVKIFMGSETGNYKTYLKSRFTQVNSAKPRLSVINQQGIEGFPPGIAGNVLRLHWF